jgi:hypothetical protein
LREKQALLRVINNLCYVCTLISVPLAIYLYFRTLQERAPAYYVSPERTRIIDTTVPAPTELQVLYKGKDLRANVSALIVYVWNDGKLPIKAEDVLEPLKLELDPACQILDARLLKVSRSVTKFAKGEVSQTTPNSLPISFGILEYGDGAAIQIIYAGNPDAEAKMLGVVIGASQPRAVASTRPSTLRQLHRFRAVAMYVAFFIVAFMIVFPAYRLLRRRQQRQPWGVLDRAYFFSVVLYLGMGAYLIYDFHHRSEPAVPRTIWAEQ